VDQECSSTALEKRLIVASVPQRLAGNNKEQTRET
jgi:hypothetical protein